MKKIFEVKRKGCHFTEEEIWNIFTQILKGLNAVHSLKITHRDLKVRWKVIGRVPTCT